MADTAIEWTDTVWNPVIGCSRVSAGCEHCYAERVAHRGMSEQHRGLTVLGRKGPRWTGEVRFLHDRLAEPLSWRKPRLVRTTATQIVLRGPRGREERWSRRKGRRVGPYGGFSAPSIHREDLAELNRRAQ